jgi:hypothetical protein
VRCWDIIGDVSDTTERDQWHFDDRWYDVTIAGVSCLDRDGMAFELDDIGPSPGRGLVLEAFRDGATGNMTFTSRTTEPLPFRLVEAFIAEARRTLSPTEK